MRPPLGRAAVIRADARHLPLPDASVDLIVTSPPYWSLRDYRDDGESLAGQIGNEPTPGEYIAVLLECTREWMRVLKPEGSIFVNLGDKYMDKSLLYLPERYRIATYDQLGLIGRAVIIWSKANGLPSRVTDRVNVSHEDWVHLTKRSRYYSAVDEIRKQGTGRGSLTWEQRKALGEPMRQGEQRRTFPDGMAPNPLGKLPGSVWEIGSQPLVVPDHIAHERCCGGTDPGCDKDLAHHAAFPPALVRRIILGWSPPGICVACGEGRRPVAQVSRTSSESYRPVYGAGSHGKWHSTLGPRGVVASITGYVCACPEPTAPTRPSVVLDPFSGTGTTPMVAKALGRIGIGADLGHDYCRLAQWRTGDPAELARVRGERKPIKPTTGQLDLLGEAP